MMPFNVPSIMPILPKGWLHLNGGTCREVDSREYYFQTTKVNFLKEMNPNVRTYGWIVIQDNKHPIHHQTLFNGVTSYACDLRAGPELQRDYNPNNIFDLAMMEGKAFLEKCGFTPKEIIDVIY